MSGDASKGSYFSNGYTYSGHPVACAAALANIEIFEKDGLLEHVRDVSGYFAEALQGLSDLEAVADVRSSGLVGCVECMTDATRAEVLPEDAAFAAEIDAICFELGLIVRPIGDMCVISPPLVITRAQIDDICAILRQAITKATENLKARQSA